ncbi:MAG: B12-binding domain-containing radical SAM protein, partial [Candidatus Hydrogenedentota bacterium]
MTLKRSAPLRVCVVFPNTYHAGMSNLAVHTLYSILNSRRDCVCERSFCEEPLLGYSLETGSRLETFDIIAFSISFELDYPNVLKTIMA